MSLNRLFVLRSVQKSLQILGITIMVWLFFKTFFYIHRKKRWFHKNFRNLIFHGFSRFRVSGSRCDYFLKMPVCFCLPVVCLCVWQKVCIKCRSRTKAQNLMKLYIQSYYSINWCLSTFGENRLTGGTAVSLFQKIWG